MMTNNLKNIKINNNNFIINTVAMNYHSITMIYILEKKNQKIEQRDE